MRIRFLSLSLCVIFFCACSKDDNNGGANNNAVKLSRVLLNGQVVHALSYNTNGQMIKETNYFSGGVVTSETERFYDPSGKLSKTVTAINISSSMGQPQFDSSYSEYVYNDAGRVKETKNFHKVNNAFQNTGKSIYEYDGAQVIAVTVYDINGQAITKNTYRYDGENVIFQQFFQYSSQVQGASIVYTYEYDNQKNPFRGISTLPYNANANNVVKTVITNFVQTPGTPVSATQLSQYKSYNAAGYPLLLSDNNIEFTYEYK